LQPLSRSEKSETQGLEPGAENGLDGGILSRRDPLPLFMGHGPPFTARAAEGFHSLLPGRFLADDYDGNGLLGLAAEALQAIIEKQPVVVEAGDDDGETFPVAALRDPARRLIVKRSFCPRQIHGQAQRAL
jgi:hypothetical protein